jgi:hypothetical protein
MLVELVRYSVLVRGIPTVCRDKAGMSARLTSNIHIGGELPLLYGGLYVLIT